MTGHLLCCLVTAIDLDHRQDEGLNLSLANHVAVPAPTKSSIRLDGFTASTAPSSLPDDEKEDPRFVLKFVLTKSCSEVIAGDMLW